MEVLLLVLQNGLRFWFLHILAIKPIASVRYRLCYLAVITYTISLLPPPGYWRSDLSVSSVEKYRINAEYLRSLLLSDSTAIIFAKFGLSRGVPRSLAVSYRGTGVRMPPSRLLHGDHADYDHTHMISAAGWFLPRDGGCWHLTTHLSLLFVRSHSSFWRTTASSFP